MTVVILEDAAEDLESGAQFYESCATGVGEVDDDVATFMPFWICGAIPFGFGSTCGRDVECVPLP